MTRPPAADAPRDLGPQPLVDLMRAHALEPRHLIDASTDQLTFKMVARAMKGRRLTRNAIEKVLSALNAACGRSYSAQDAFNYVKGA